MNLPARTPSRSAVTLPRERRALTYALVPADPRQPAWGIAESLAHGIAAQLAVRVLLVDARFDLPAREPDSPGRAELLRRHGGPALPDYVTLANGLTALRRGSGEAPPPAETQRALQELLGSWQAEYEVVMVLTSPVLDSVYARALAPLAEKALLLVHEDETKFLELERSRELLLESLATDIDIVLHQPAISWRQRLFAPPAAILQRVARRTSLLAGGLWRRLPRPGSAVAKPVGAEREADGV